MISRRTLLAHLASAASLALGGAVGCCGAGGQAEGGPPEDGPAEVPGRRRMPVLFVGHGSPMNAVEDNRWSRGFAALRDEIQRPKAILAVSAHWYVDGTALTSGPAPRTIHDFSGFPPPLFEIDYPAPGRDDLTRRVRALLGEERAALSGDWGLDHGTWSVLHRMYPEADIPVVQLSIDRRLDPQGHYQLGRSLAELREEGVLVLGSGNIVHNLRDAAKRKRAGEVSAPEWASRFDDAVAEALLQHDTTALLSRLPGSDEGRLAHPSPDHWLPLIYACGATDEQDRIRFPIEGFDWGSISMRSVLFG